MPSSGPHPLIDEILSKAHTREKELAATLQAWLRIAPRLRAKKKAMARFEVLKEITLNLVGSPDQGTPKTIAELAWSKSPSSPDTGSSEKQTSSAKLSTIPTP